VNLWPPQVEAIRVCAEAHSKSSSRVLVQLPTGTGKTTIAQHVALAYIKRPFGRALIVVPTAQILEQFVARLGSATRHTVHVDKAGRRAPVGARLVVASQNTLWERLGQYDPETLCIFDECHHANLDAAENLRIASSFHHVVGLSASPWSRGCDALFADAAHVVLPLSEAQALGLVAPLRIEPWCAPTGPHAIVFCGTNADAEKQAAAHAGATWIGVNSGDVEVRVSAWRSGRYPIVFANRMLGEGFDEPRCSRVWLDVLSSSDIRYVQMAGRALRFQPGKVAHIHCRTPTIARRLRRALVRAGFDPVFQPFLNAE
jgi:superfamily II DNA or RNA helicase